eukprot:Tamp_14122.p2 GENE.Tamp_14122~~Tamp_14122.p2  ORF type:complete len:107 (+),score=22.25 Tamp_14122:787-1107(+)
MGDSVPHALMTGDTVGLRDSDAHHVRADTTTLSLAKNAPFTLPQLKWKPPSVPLSHAQREYKTEQQALAAVDQAIPKINKASKMVQKVMVAATKDPHEMPKQDVFF